MLGGDRAPAAVLGGVRLALEADPDLKVVLVGPADVAGPLTTDPRVTVLAATEAVSMAERPTRAVRAKRGATIRVAMAALRDGAADAVISAGPTGATMVAALFVLGPLPGVARPPVAVTIPSAAGPVLLLDAGANVDCAAELLVQFAYAGVALFGVLHGGPTPRVGLLSIGSEDGKGDSLRREAFALLGETSLSFVGMVESGDVTRGGMADVVVTDGFTGNVLVKGLEGMHALARGVVAGTDEGAAHALDALSPHRQAGLLVGVEGVVVVAHGDAGPTAVAAAIATAARAARGQVVERVRVAMAELVARRRDLAGLT